MKCRLSNLSGRCCPDCYHRKPENSDEVILEITRYCRDTGIRSGRFAARCGVAPLTVRRWKGENFPQDALLDQLMGVITEHEVKHVPGECPLSAALKCSERGIKD
jgi:hypothetical protein